MALNEFAGATTTAGALVRFDTDPNAVSPADVRLSPWAASSIPGSVVQAGGDGSVPVVYSPSATLYQKTVSRSAPWKTLSSVTLTGVSTDTGLFPTPLKTGAYTALSGQLVMADVSGGSLSVTLPAAVVGAKVGILIAVIDLPDQLNVVHVLPAGSDDFWGRAALNTTAGDPQTGDLTGCGDFGLFECFVAGHWNRL